MMVSTYAFEVMDKNNVVSKVCVANGVVTVDKFTENPAIQPFCGEKTDLVRVERFLKARCFDEKRPDAKELLGYLGLSSYNPLAIVRKTHGRMWHDMLWIRFKGENLSWEDVKDGKL